MKIERSQDHFSEGWGLFDVDCVLRNTEGAEIKIVKFMGFSEISETDSTGHETVNVHFSDGSVIEFEDLDRAVFMDRSYEPVSPDWFMEEVADRRGESPAQNEVSEAEREAERAALRIHAEIKAEVEARPVEYMTDSELFAKVSGAPLSIAEEMLIVYEGNLIRMASTTAKQMQKIRGIGKTRSEKIVAALELGKRLARFHAQKDKITAPCDVADLMMSKMRYLQKEIVVVLCLDTKGNVTTKGKAGDLAGDLKWGKLLGESTVFEGTLNSSVFHPREIFRFAIEESANSIVLVHNHPSGDPQPSREDIRATKQLIEAGNHIGINILDHVVIGDGIFVSLKEEGFI